MSWTRPCPGVDWIHSLLCLTLLLWTKRVNGLSDFSNYLSRILSSHSAHACDGSPLRLHCPRHSTISIQSAFYGRGEVWPCRGDPPSRPHNHSCSAFTALQKLLSECQSHRDCQLPVNHLLFGRDPCPGTTKYLHVEYKCKPTEHKTRLACEGETMTLHCKPPKVLLIYAAVYGRRPGHTDTCPSHQTKPLPPFECLNHEALHLVSKSCHSKQKCAVAVGNQTFRDPCSPGTRKYLSVLYSCVPQVLLKEADPDVFSSTTIKASPSDLEEPPPTESGTPEDSGAIMSNSLLTYTYIKEHSEMAALLFTSSVCVGLLFTLLALSVRVTCGGRGVRPGGEDDDDDYEDYITGEEDDSSTEGSSLSTVDRTPMFAWEEAGPLSEAAERAERIERREMIIQEIWMNSYLNGNFC